MSARDVARRDAVDGKRHNVRRLGLWPEGGKDRVQRAHPAEIPRAPAHGLRPGKFPDDRGKDLGDDVDGDAPRFLDQRHVDVALLGVLLDPGLVDRGEPRALEKPGNRLLRRADARAALLLVQVRLARGQAFDGEREPPRRDERSGALVAEPGIDQTLGDDPLEILGGFLLHPRRDFLGEQLEQKIRHGDNFRVRRPGQASAASASRDP